MAVDQQTTETIFLKHSKHIKLFRFLQSHSSARDTWSDLDEIARTLNISVTETKRRINYLNKQSGMRIHYFTDDKGKKRFGLDPEHLDISVKQISKRKRDMPRYGALYIGEPCFGTKAFDHEYTMKGLAYFLKVNNLSEQIQEVIMQGGVIPHVPPYSSRGNDTDMKFLDMIERDGENHADKFLEQKIETEWERQFTRKFLRNGKYKKIDTLSEAFRAAGNQVEILMKDLPEDTCLRIQLGEEDRKNKQNIQDTFIQKWAGEKDEYIKQVFEEISEKYHKQYLRSIDPFSTQISLEKFLNNKSLLRQDKEKRADFKQRFYDSNPEIVDEVKQEIATFWKRCELEDKILDKEDLEDMIATEIDHNLNIISRYIKNNVTKKIRSKHSSAKNILGKIEKKRERINTDCQDLDVFGTWIDQLLKTRRWAITTFTRQYPCTPSENELAYKKAKDMYNSHFYMWDIPQSIVVHDSPRKSYEIDLGIPVMGKDNEIAKVNYSIQHENGKTIMLIHNMRHIFSDSISASNIKDSKIMMNFQNMVLQKLYSDRIEHLMPDIVLLGAHATGGLRIFPYPKKTEALVKDEFFEGNDITYLVSLPTLQDIPKLQWLVDKGFKNWHTKRYQKGPYASGAVIHTEDDDGVNNFWMIDSAILYKTGKLAEEIETYKRELKDVEDSKTRLEIEKIIVDKETEIKADLKKIEVGGDFHFGDPDDPDRYSKFQIIEAAQIYQREHGLPDMVSYDEIVNGCETKMYNGAARSICMDATKLKNVLEDMINDDNVNKEEIVKLALSQQRGISVQNLSAQYEAFQRACQPYLQEVIEKGGRIYLTSGNHHQHSHKDGDEATNLGLMFNPELKDKKVVNIFHGNGNKLGVGWERLHHDMRDKFSKDVWDEAELPGTDGRKFLIIHKMPTNTDEIYGPMMHLRKRNDDSDIVLLGHTHQVCAGYADARAMAEHPGDASMNLYCPLIGKPAGLAGFINLSYDVKRRGVYKFSFILNPTLNDIIKERNLL